MRERATSPTEHYHSAMAFHPDADASRPPVLPPERTPPPAPPAPPLTVERAGPDAAESVYALLAACGRAMAAKGFANWNPPPTSVERLRADAAHAVLLVARTAHGAVVGTALLAPAPARPYDGDVRAGRVRWHAPDGVRACYVNRLAVHPAWQGRGAARQLLDAVAAHARAAGASVVRFDALAEHAGLNAWYARLGCRPCGTRPHSGRQFAVFEKAL
jgi:GNAT superfamily N-acetyltransferase